MLDFRLKNLKKILVKKTYDRVFRKPLLNEPLRLKLEYFI